MLKKFKKASVRWSVLGIAVVSLLAFITLTSAKVDVSRVSPEVATGSTNDASSTATPLTPIEASLTPIELNQKVVEESKKNSMYYQYANETDIASIAYGHLLAEDRPQDYLPAQPLFVKSYDPKFRDYYIVPFVKDGKYVGRVMVVIWANGKASLSGNSPGNAGFYPFNDPKDKLFELDAQEATAIIRKTTNIKNIPAPKLACHSGSYLQSYLFWEFDLQGNKKLFVSQSDGTVSDSLPLTDEKSINQAKKRYQVPGKNWSFSITLLELQQSTGLQGFPYNAELFITLFNNDGTDKAFLPKGQFVALVGLGGKKYSSSEELSLDKAYSYNQQSRENITDNNGLNQPGSTPIHLYFTVDAGEKGVKKLIYQDENGKQTEIQLDTITTMFSLGNTWASKLY